MGNINSPFNTDIFNAEYALNCQKIVPFISYVFIKCENVWSYLLGSGLK